MIYQKVSIASRQSNVNKWNGDRGDHRGVEHAVELGIVEIV